MSTRARVPSSCAHMLAGANTYPKRRRRDGRPKGPPVAPSAAERELRRDVYLTRNGMTSRATMLMTLIIGLMAGHAVSLYGSPVTAAAWASEPLPPISPSSMSFLALSQAPPPLVMLMARNRPVMMEPMSTPPRTRYALFQKTSVMMIGVSTGMAAGSIISRIADLVTMSTALPYSGFSVPFMMPGSSRNWRRTSSTTLPPARPTDCMQSEANR